MIRGFSRWQLNLHHLLSPYCHPTTQVEDQTNDSLVLPTLPTGRQAGEPENDIQSEGGSEVAN